jgi:enamine deaminase RidA (YjgF/YER057c/UK114 family)
MSIIRHEIRQISDENRGQPIISQAVAHGNVAYLAGITPNPIVGDIKTQTAQVLRRVDELLKRAGTAAICRCSQRVLSLRYRHR